MASSRFFRGGGEDFSKETLRKERHRKSPSIRATILNLGTLKTDLSGRRNLLSPQLGIADAIRVYRKSNYNVHSGNGA
jgi:hypothetical protein